VTKRLTTEQFITRAIGIHGAAFGYDKAIYQNWNTHLIIICPVHGEFRQSPKSHLSGNGCNKCRTPIHDETSFITVAQSIHGKKYDYSDVVYTRTHELVTISCPDHGKFQQTPHNHIRSSGCPKCGYEALGNLKRSTLDNFVQSAIMTHGDVYGYDDVIYVGSGKPVVISCPYHGKFQQSPASHLSGTGCPRCSREMMGNNCTKSGSLFIQQSRQIHGHRYDYSMTDYHRGNIPVTIGCHIHGEFSQKPSIHLTGSGCPLCGNARARDTMRKSNTIFVNEAKLVHNNRYHYKGDYINNTSIISIICPDHGEFKQIARNHLSGKGCPKCTHNISKPSQAWLDSLGIPDDSEHREVTKLVGRYSVDGYDPETNTVYEFQGDYWHGNPKIYESNQMNKSVGKTHGELYQKTIEKKSKFIESGFKYIEIWESEWNALTCDKS